MGTIIRTADASRGMRWTGRIASGLVALFMAFDTAIHLTMPAPVTDAFARLGVSATLSRPIGLLELICVIAYVVPRTALLGAVLLTGYLGGAIAIQLRAGSPLVSETLFPVYVGVILWAGVYLRNGTLRALIGGRRRG